MTKHKNDAPETKPEVISPQPLGPDGKPLKRPKNEKSEQDDDDERETGGAAGRGKYTIQE